MTLKKEKDELIDLTLSSLKYSADVIDRPCFSKIFLDAKIFCPIYSCLRISIISIIIFIATILLLMLMYLFFNEYEVLTIIVKNINGREIAANIKNIIPLLLLSLPLTLLLLDKPLSQFNLYIVDAGVDMTHIPMPEKKDNHTCIATRILHPGLAEPTLEKRKRNPNSTLEWINSWLLQGLKINVLRVVLGQHFTDISYVNKLIISLQLHRVQLLTYLLLLLFTTFWAYFSDYHLAHNTKYILRTLGLLWWLLSIFLYRKQIRDLNYWMEKARRQFRSIYLPLFIWNRQENYWRELTLNEINKPFVKEYGLEAEKLIALTQGFLLILHQTYLGFL